jgi:6-phosphogluconolactonase/glucosamine-6-phosphate isomerase/deaminase
LLFQRLASVGFKWDGVHLFWVDERPVPRMTTAATTSWADAHTASLFPAQPLIDDAEEIAAPVQSGKLRQWRITQPPGVLLAVASHRYAGGGRG